MSPISKIEIIGVFLSVAVMAIVLAFFRFSDGNIAQVVPLENQQASVIAVDESDTNQQAALADAIVNGAAGANLQSLIIDDVVIGEGETVSEGDVVSVHYIGRLQNGQEFDNSYVKAQPFTFEVGAGRVIEGWDVGVVGMKVGGQRILIIPSHLAYGDAGAGPIPGGATLVFAVELLEIK